MPTNDFLPFATAGGANVETQVNYAAAGYVSTGRASGILPSNVYNKIARQSSIAAYLLGQLVVDQLGVDALDNGTVATVLANLKLAIAKTPTQPTVQKFTSGSGTYTPTSANVRRVRVRMIGGGGGGGARTTNSGVAGSASTFQAGAWTAAGGAAGTVAGAGGAGGGGGADGSGTLIVRILGQDGGVSTVQTDATGDSQAIFVGGTGGCSAFGGGGAQAATTGGTARTNSGGGGAGGNSLVATKGGGGGGAGEYVEFWITSPAAATYVVGAGGAGGAAGGSGGGAGATGILICEEFYS